MSRPREISASFLRRLQDYDSALKITRSRLTQRLCLERRISNRSQESLEPRKKILFKIANRAKITTNLDEKPGQSSRQPTEETDQQRRAQEIVWNYRRRCADELDALNRGFEWIFYIPEPIDFRMEQLVLATLRNDDIWAAGGADALCAQQDAEEKSNEERITRRFLLENQGRASEAYNALLRKAGEQTFVPRQYQGGALALPA